MELTFNNNSTEFRADSHFNLHIEGAGSVSFYRRTSGTEWDFVRHLVGSVIDEDVAVNIPKEYRISCSVKPSKVVITFNGGVILDVVIPDEPSGDVPEGYDLFVTYDGDFLTADGEELYVLS